MSQKDVQIHSDWRFMYERGVSNGLITYSNSFSSNSIHGVKFDIFCGLLKENECIIVLSKTPCTPADATFKILINSKAYTEYIDGWINNCTFKYSLTSTCASPYAEYNFSCTITWHGFKDSLPNAIHANLKNFNSSPDLSDMKIVIGKEEIPVHKMILASYSPVFLTMFKANMKESRDKRIIVTDIDVNIMKKVIDFMYTGALHPDPEVPDLLSILNVAEKYEIMALKAFCERKLIKKMAVENVLEILDEPSVYGVPQLIQAATGFMIDHKSAIMKLEKFADLHRRKPELLVDFVVRTMAAN
ncbi:hypothetical protein PV327_008152 [Microctonus hyperodae]|uniref:BTB domain-containing protein n=1 Tax=Microctonus hyperodae TaxID=165561 RepID=A0AA39F2H6_MICHY|nr:hypothetical protein PV327_008152 [Microctonus hyperodae]